MTRTVDHRRRAELMNGISAYVLEHGMAELSLRPLADAVGVSPRTLLYHFASKEAIVTTVIERIRRRQLAMFDELRRSELPGPGAICRAAWTYMSMAEVRPMLRLFFETYALALRNPERFPGFLDRAVEDWLAFLAEPHLAAGVEPQHARRIATIVLAGYRGFMLDFAATGDRERIGGAVDAWAAAIDAIAPEKEPHDAAQA
jgi:AcrR family transcriptional regulator